MRILTALVILWVFAYGWSILSTQVTTPTGDGFTRGMNLVVGFVVWQCIAALIAMAIWWIGTRRARTPLKRWLARGPLLLALLPVLFVVALIVYINVFPQGAGPNADPPATTRAE